LYGHCHRAASSGICAGIGAGWHRRCSSIIGIGLLRRRSTSSIRTCLIVARRRCRRATRPICVATRPPTSVRRGRRGPNSSIISACLIGTRRCRRGSCPISVATCPTLPPGSISASFAASICRGTKGLTDKLTAQVGLCLCVWVSGRADKFFS
jgi:hypothetical protein